MNVQYTVLYTVHVLHIVLLIRIEYLSLNCRINSYAAIWLTVLTFQLHFAFFLFFFSLVLLFFVACYLYLLFFFPSSQSFYLIVSMLGYFFLLLQIQYINTTAKKTTTYLTYRQIHFDYYYRMLHALLFFLRQLHDVLCFCSSFFSVTFHRFYHISFVQFPFEEAKKKYSGIKGVHFQKTIQTHKKGERERKKLPFGYVADFL